MSLQLTHLDTGLLLTVHALGELTVLEQVSTHLDDHDLTVVIDVSEMTMAPHLDVEQFVGEIRNAASQGTHRWSLVAGRSTARQILRQLLTGSAIGVHATVDAALLALQPRASAT